MTNLKDIIPNDEDFVIILDRHQSITKVVGVVYKKSQHEFCTWHLSQTIKLWVTFTSHSNVKSDGDKGKDKAHLPPCCKEVYGCFLSHTQCLSSIDFTIT